MIIINIVLAAYKRICMLLVYCSEFKVK